MFLKLKRLSRRKKNKLKKATYDEISRFSFNGLFTHVKILDIYDGDTCTIAFYFNKKITKVSVRILGIDTPEIRTKNIQEKVAGVLAKQQLLKLTSYDELLYAKFDKFDKYGRPLVILFNKKSMSSDSIGILGKFPLLPLKFKNSVNQTMIDTGYALSYNGGTKSEFDFNNYPEKIITHKII